MVKAERSFRIFRQNYEAKPLILQPPCVSPGRV